MTTSDEIMAVLEEQDNVTYFERSIGGMYNDRDDFTFDTDDDDHDSVIDAVDEILDSDEYMEVTQADSSGCMFYIYK